MGVYVKEVQIRNIFSKEVDPKIYFEMSLSESGYPLSNLSQPVPKRKLKRFSRDTVDRLRVP